MGSGSCVARVETSRGLAPCGCRVPRLIVVGIKIVVSRHIIRLLRAKNFRVVFFDHPMLNHLATLRIYRMCDVGVELSAPVGIERHAVGRQGCPALVTVLRAQVIFRAATGAMARQLAARHRNERAIGSIDDLEIAHDEAVVERDRAKRLEPFALFVHQLDSHLSDFHATSLQAGQVPVRGASKIELVKSATRRGDYAP